MLVLRDRASTEVSNRRQLRLSVEAWREFFLNLERQREHCGPGFRMQSSFVGEIGHCYEKKRKFSLIQEQRDEESGGEIYTAK